MLQARLLSDYNPLPLSTIRHFRITWDKHCEAAYRSNLLAVPTPLMTRNITC